MDQLPVKAVFVASARPLTVLLIGHSRLPLEEATPEHTPASHVGLLAHKRSSLVDGSGLTAAARD